MSIIVPIWAFVTGTVLLTGLLGAIPAVGKYLEKLAKWLGTFQIAIGIIAIIVGALWFSWITGLILILAGIILAIGFLQTIPAIGKYLDKVAKVLAAVQTPMGIVLFVVAILDLVGVF